MAAAVPAISVGIGAYPAVPLEAILHENSERIEALRQATGVPDEHYTKHYRPVIENCAKAFHLLPASESHHHRTTGGLFAHSLETAYWALIRAEDVLVAGQELPRKRRLIETRFRFGAFLAGLLHDAGKPLSDLVVTNRSGEQQWSPLNVYLMDWLRDARLDEYYVTWREGRHKHHEGLSLQMALRIVPDTEWVWISEAGPELLSELQSAIAGMETQTTNRFRALVQGADQASVSANLRAMGQTGDTSGAGPAGFPVERLIIDAMRRLIKDGSWTVNTDGGRVWIMDNGAYVVWPQGAAEVIERLLQDGVRGVLRDPDLLADMLIERSLATRTTAGHRTWHIRPEILTRRLPGIYLRAIRLDPALLFAVPPPPTAGTIGQDGSAAKNPHVAADTVPTPSPAPAQQPERPVPQITAPPRQPAIAEPAASPTVATVQKYVPEVVLPLESSPTTEAHDVDHLAQATVYMLSHGIAGQVLSTLAQDLRSGSRNFGKDAIWLPDGCMALAWPQAIAAYGMESRDALVCMQDADWLIPDPVNPLRKISEISGFAGGARKAVTLNNTVSRHMRALVEHGTAAPSLDSSKPVQPAASIPATPPKPSAPTNPADARQDAQAPVAVTPPPGPHPVAVAEQVNDLAADIVRRAGAKREGQWLALTRDALNGYLRAAGYKLPALRTELKKAGIGIKIEVENTARNGRTQNQARGKKNDPG